MAGRGVLHNRKGYRSRVLLLQMTPMLMPAWLDPERIITAAGPWALWVVALIVFAECGIFSLLPGDSLLFTVGLMVAGAGTAKPAISYGPPGVTLLICCLVLTVAAIFGNLSGYYLGRLIGPPLFKPRDGLMGKLFDPRHVARTQDFFARYGPRALILARFIPLVRTFVTLVAGVAHMDLKRFMGYTAVGGVLWAFGVTILGFFLGQVAFVRDNIEIVLILIVLVSLVPMVIEYVMGRRKNRGAPTAA